MNVTPIIRLLLVCTFPLAGFATTFSGGDLDTVGNWDAGLPTSATGNVGTSGSFNTTTPVTGRVWNVNQTGGTITQTVNTTAVDFDGGSWTMSGGIMNTDFINYTDFNLTIGGGASLNLDTNSGASSLNGSSTITLNDASSMISGVGSTGGDGVQVFSGSSFVINDGTVTDLYLQLRGGTLTVNGGDVTFDRFRVRTASTATLNGGNVSFADNAQGESLAPFNFTLNSTASLTRTGGSSTWYEAAWDAGEFRYDGDDFNDLGNWTAVEGSVFQVSGTTVSLIPEPSSIALLGLAGLAVYMVRHRK